MDEFFGYTKDYLSERTERRVYYLRKRLRDPITHSFDAVLDNILDKNKFDIKKYIDEFYKEQHSSRSMPMLYCSKESFNMIFKIEKEHGKKHYEFHKKFFSCM